MAELAQADFDKENASRNSANEEASKPQIKASPAATGGVLGSILASGAGKQHSGTGQHDSKRRRRHS